MKTTQALIFLLVGLGMCFGPAIWPQEFMSRETADPSELWLLVMGGAQAIMGAWMLGLNEVPRLGAWMRNWEPLEMQFIPAEVGAVLSESFYSTLSAEEEVGLAFTLQQQLLRGRA